MLQINKEEAGKRLDLYLTEQLSLSRSAVAKLIREGQVCLEGKPLPKNYKLRGGETITVELPEAVPDLPQPEDSPLDIVYEDEDLAVINKPKGLVVHPAPGHLGGTLVNGLLYRYGREGLSSLGGEERPGIVHRIDKDTSGLLVVAKNDEAHQSLKDQLQDHSLSRVYRCIVLGKLKEESGTVSAPIGRHPVDRKRMAVRPEGREAVTHWRVLERYPGYTYIECQLETGRTHQIRVHMAHLGHPVLGDRVYGGKKPVPGLEGQCLHALTLRFRHPRSGEPTEVSCPLPEEFLHQLRKLREKDKN